MVVGVLASMVLTAPLAAAQPAESAAAESSAKLTAAVRQVMRQNSIPGAIVGIWQPGKSPYVEAFGVRDKASGKPMTPRLYMRIGSETKTFTGTAILQLVDEGKVGLDDPISKYVDGVPGGDAITIRELGEMRSGIASYTKDPDWVQAWQADPYRAWTPSELLSYGFSQPALFAPGTEFDYSNTNTILLGLVVERVSGEPLHEYIAEHILEPAHLSDTTFPTNAAFPKPHASGYTAQTASGKVADSADWNPSWGWAAGAMISDLDDMRRWAKVVAEGSLLTPETQAERERFLPVPGRKPARYGFALFNVNGWIGHNGSIPGYQSLTVHLPSKRATMVILLNTDIGPPDAELTTLVGKSVTKVVSPRHRFFFKQRLPHHRRP